MSHEKKDHDGFEGKLYAHPPMRNALIAGGLTLLAFGLGHLCRSNAIMSDVSKIEMSYDPKLAKM